MSVRHTRPPHHLLGVDGGLLVALVDDRPTAGITGRTLITFAFVHLYLRGGGTFGDDSFTFLELGLLGKLPVYPSEPPDRASPHH